MIIGVIGIWKTNEEFKLTNNGIGVVAKVIEAPNSCENISTRGGYCKLQYNNKIFIKRAGNKFCHLVSNKETVKMISNKIGSELIFENEYEKSEFIYSGLISLMGLFIAIKSVRKKN
jgi:hypothetical protein